MQPCPQCTGVGPENCHCPRPRVDEETVPATSPVVLENQHLDVELFYPLPRTDGISRSEVKVSLILPNTTVAPLEIRWDHEYGAWYVVCGGVPWRPLI